MSLDPFQQALIAALQEQAAKIEALEKRLAAVEAVEPKQYLLTDDTPEEVIEYLQSITDKVTAATDKLDKRVERFDQHLLDHENEASRLGTSFWSNRALIIDEIIRSDEEALLKPR